MEGGHAIAIVSAALKQLLENALVSDATGISGASVSLLPPDRVVTGAQETAQLNLFLYRVAPYAALRRDAPAVDKGFALELFYLLTAYGHEFQAELLLGQALRLLHQHAEMDASQLERAAQSEKALKAARKTPRRTKEITAVKITPLYLSFDEMTRLWSMLHATYRPSVACQVSAVFIHTD